MDKSKELIKKIEKRFNMNSFSWNKDKYSFMEFVSKEAKLSTLEKVREIIDKYIKYTIKDLGDRGSIDLETLKDEFKQRTG